MTGEALEKAWRDRAGLSPLSPLMAFGPDGLTLGAGTVLAPVEALNSADLPDAQSEARLCALLSAAYRQPIGPQAIRYIRRGAASWRDGDKAMAAMHLAMTGLTPLRDVKVAARRLFMADALMKAGTTPDVILRALELPAGAAEEVLTRYDDQEYRNPKGSGRVSGRWALEHAPAVTQLANSQRREAAKPVGSRGSAKPVVTSMPAYGRPSVGTSAGNASAGSPSGRPASGETSGNSVVTPNVRGGRHASSGGSRSGAALNLPLPESGASLLEPASARVLTSEQNDIATSLRGVITNTGRLTPNTYFTMTNSGLKIGDVLKPGIYQAEFDPESGGRRVFIPVPNAAHSRYVYIDRNRNSWIISGAPGPTGKRLSVVTGSFDGTGRHSLGTVVGQRSETVALYDVGLPRGRSASQVWANLNYTAQKIQSANLNYNIIKQNSNSLFYTLAKYGKLKVNTQNNTPGRETDLISIINGSSGRNHHLPVHPG